MQMIPAVIEHDIESFGEAVNHLQTVGFKKEEVSLQPEEVRSVITFMRSAGTHGAGMSSFGPAIYGFVEKKTEARKVQEDVQVFLDETLGGVSMLTKASNKGAKITR